MKFNLMEALTAAGFTPVTDPFGFANNGQLVEKTFERKVETAWNGTQKSEITVSIRFASDFDYLTVSYSHNGQKPFKVKSHSANRRALNAIYATLAHNGFAL